MLKILSAILLFAACPDRTLVHVGNNTAVPRSSVRQYATEHGISFHEAARRIGVQPLADAWRE